MNRATHADFDTDETAAASEKTDSTTDGIRPAAASAPAKADTRPQATADLARQAEAQSVLYTLTDRLHRAETREAIYEAALDAMFEGLGCARAAIVLVADGALKFVAWRGLSDGYRKAVEGHSPFKRDYADAMPIAIGDVESADIDAPFKAAIGRERMRALVFFPLVAERAVIGRFTAFYDRPQQFDGARIDLGITIARQLAFAVSRISAAEARASAEQELRREQELLRTILERLPVMITLHTPDARVVDLNAEFQRTIGWSNADTAEISLLEECYPDPAYRAEVEAFMTACNGEWMDIRMRNRAGETVDTTWTNIRLSRGVQIGIGLDITARKRTEEALRRSMEAERARLLELETVMEAVPAAIWVSRDPRCGVVTGNPAAYEMFRETPGDNIAVSARTERPLGFAAFVDGRALSVEELPLRRACAGESVRDLDIEYRFSDGTIRHMVANATPLRDANGNVSGGVAAFIDVTDRKRARDAQEHLASIVESSDDAIISKDTNGTIISWNRGAERLFGYTAGEIIGKNITTIIPGHLLSEEPKILGRIRRGERIDHYETVRRRKDGMLVDISLTVSPMRNARGEIVAASKIARDISEKKKAEAQHNLLMAELNHRVKNTLATVISIARQSFAGTETAEARKTFEARIRGLAQAHGRLAETNWESVSLETLLDDEFAPYRQTGSDNVNLSGPAVALSPKCALTLGLAIHELATNAAKYGALTTSSGTVDVGWSIDPDDNSLLVTWAEKGGPPVRAPGRRGFGRLLLERVVAADLKSKVRLDFAPDGLRFTARIPSVQYRTHAQ